MVLIEADLCGSGASGANAGFLMPMWARFSSLVAWTSSLEDLGSKTVTVASDTLLTSPLPAELDALGWDDGTSVCDARRRLNHYRRTPDGRLLFGKGGAGMTYGNSSASTQRGPPRRMGELRRHLARLFPSLADAPVASSWTAPVEYSVTSLPFAGRPAARPSVRQRRR